MMTRKHENESVCSAAKKQKPMGEAGPHKTPTLYITFEVPGDPTGKERARSGRGGRHYTPDRTSAYEKTVAHYAINTLCCGPEYISRLWPTDRQVYMDLWIYHRNGKHPDADNVVKAIQDGLSGILWINDNKVLPRVFEVSWPCSYPHVKVEIKETGK